MKHLLLVSLSMTMFGWWDWYFNQPSYSIKIPTHPQAYAIVPPSQIPTAPQLITPQSIKNLLTQTENHLRPEVIEHVLMSLDCAQKHQITVQPVLTLIDYSLPSNQKRLWVFYLAHQKRLFYTYVSHGLKSGETQSNYFSNRNNSRASSIGVYRTEQSYYGREGLSLRLTGLDPYFNDNATLRSIVMHGGWYVGEDFIKRYGRAGRSWGCPALPLNEYRQIIQSIKNNSLLIVYYPNERWIQSSKFLNCSKHPLPKPIPEPKPSAQDVQTSQNTKFETVLFANLSHRNRLEESSPIMAMPAQFYARYFHQAPPLKRMIRRQVNQQEFIAINIDEFQHLSLHSNAEILSQLYFILPSLKMVNGYYETVMKPVNFGKIKSIEFKTSPIPNYQVFFETRAPLSLVTTNRFIRWLGL
jgi:hypothetical protein